MFKSLILSFFLLATFQIAYGQEKILILGDSLTEGYRLDREDSFPSQLQLQLVKNQHDYKVINGGVSGSTTASGLSRLKWFLKAKPKIIVIALGANDGLRGIKLEDSKENLDKLIKVAKENKLKVIIAGMQIPPNYGKEYTAKFKAIYPDLAKKYDIKLLPFLLKDVAGKKELNIEDGIHPNAAGYKIIANTVYENIKDLL